LGIHIDTQLGLFLVPPAKKATVQGAASSLLSYGKSHRRWVSAKKIANICGLVISLSVALPLARTVTRSLYDVLATKVSWNSDVRLNKQAIRDLLFLRDLRSESCDKAIWKPSPTATLHTDASDFGWGAVWQDLVPAQGFFNQDQEHNLHITAKEMYAVLNALRQFSGKLDDVHTLKVITDNNAVKAVLNKGVSGSPVLMSIYRDILDLCLQKGLVLQAEYIHTSLNVKADQLSRVSPNADWSVSDEIFEEASNMFGMRTFDRFASPVSFRCDNFNTLIPHPHSQGDSMVQSWVGYKNWVCPPISLASRVIDKLLREQAEAVVVLPFWPSAPWYPVLMEMADCTRILSRQETRDHVIPHGPGPPDIWRNPRWQLMLVHLPSHRSKSGGW
jgi:hypothetical protein